MPECIRSVPPSRPAPLPAMGRSIRAAFPRLFLVMLLAFPAASLPMQVLADSVLTTDGSRITGTVVHMMENTLTLETEFAGRITIPWDAVDSLETDTPVVVRLDGTPPLRGRIVEAGSGYLAVMDESTGAIATVETGQVRAVNADPDALRLTAYASLGWEKLTGNTERESLHLDAEINARKKDDRVRADGDYNWAEDSGRRSVYDWSAGLSYDRFLTERLYANTNLRFKHDQFQDLELRSTVGAGLGYQFLDDERSFLAMEAGANYVKEDLDNAENRDYAAGRLATDFSHWLLPDRLQIFHENQGLVSLEDTENLILETSTGLRMPMAWGVYLKAQVDWDWRNLPPPGNERTDRRYLLSVGYALE